MATNAPQRTTEMSNNWSVPVDPALDAATTATLAYYDEHLRAELERDHLGQLVAIHADTHEYVIGSRPGATYRALRKIQPDGYAVLLTIGPADAIFARPSRSTK